MRYSLVLIVLISLSNQSASAHSGRTDSRGGHVDRRTGRYHFHNSGSSSFSGRTFTPRTTVRTSPRLTYRSGSKTTAKIKSLTQIPSSFDDKQSFEVLRSSRWGLRTIFKVRVSLKNGAKPLKNELVKITESLKTGRGYFVHFYLPDMDIENLAWAVGSVRDGIHISVKIYDDRAPDNLLNPAHQQE